MSKLPTKTVKVDIYHHKASESGNEKTPNKKITYCSHCGDIPDQITVSLSTYTSHHFVTGKSILGNRGRIRVFSQYPC